MDLRSPAKINLYLEVTGKRPDGYHNLIMLMCFIGLFDSLHLAFGQNRISVACSYPHVPQDETNLAFRAARLFLDSSGIQEGVHMDIKKSIPIGAGLGGGSSNAAAVLLGLNKHYGSPYSIDALCQMGKHLGADVPFFIFGGPAVATGIGDVLTPFNNLKSYPILLIYPSVNISTAEVYKKLNLTLTKNKKINTNTIFKSDWGRHAPKLLRNDLETVASALCPDIQTAKQTLLGAGASGALMTGSGSSVFGLFEHRDQAQRAYHQIASDHPKWQVFLTQMTV
jgi:4-diphosphocytidyl-2-C-methyl-D-erythritol kinase